MRALMLLISLHVSACSICQSTQEKLYRAINKLDMDSQCRHGIIGLYVVDLKNDSIVFSRNAETGLAPASCQKVITSVTAFELLGKDFTYKTTFGYDGKINNGLLAGNIIIRGSADPTLGSWRYKATTEGVILANVKKAITKAGVKTFTGRILQDSDGWDAQAIPDGWIWQDIGNYYGAGAFSLNWRENQFDIILQSGSKAGDPVKVLSTNPPLVKGIALVNQLMSGEKGSGDNAYIYLPSGSTTGLIKGTIPVNENHFTISGAIPDPGGEMIRQIHDLLQPGFAGNNDSATYRSKAPLTTFLTHTSPSLDSINYWFLKKSINLYGESLVKTIAYAQQKFGSTELGLNIIKDFWSSRGIDKTSLNILDGSGLSPANRVTASVLTTVLRFAKKQKWFLSFYNALPEINGIRMKSGSISGVLSYAGYVKQSSGNEYVFAFMINNFNGSANALKKKMWKVLDELK